MQEISDQHMIPSHVTGVAPLQNLAFSLNGEWMVASNTENVLAFYQGGVPTYTYKLVAQEIKMATLMRVRSLAFDYVRPLLYIACGNLVIAFNFHEREIEWTASTHRLFAFQGILANEVSAHPEGFIAFSFDNGHFGLRNSSGMRLKSWRHNAGPRWMGFLDQGRHLIGSDGFSIKEWDMATGIPKLDYHSPTRVYRLTTSEYSNYFAARTLHRVLVYRQGETEPTHEFPIGMGLPLMAFSPDGFRLAYNSDEAVYEVDLKSGEASVHPISESHVQALAFNPVDGSVFIGGSDGLLYTFQQD